MIKATMSEILHAAEEAAQTSISQKKARKTVTTIRHALLRACRTGRPGEIRTALESLKPFPVGPTGKEARELLESLVRDDEV